MGTAVFTITNKGDADVRKFRGIVAARQAADGRRCGDNARRISDRKNDNPARGEELV